MLYHVVLVSAIHHNKAFKMGSRSPDPLLTLAAPQTQEPTPEGPQDPSGRGLRRWGGAGLGGQWGGIGTADTCEPMQAICWVILLSR